MGLGGISIWQLLIILAIVLVLFGAKRLRTLGTDLGTAVKGFKSAVKEGRRAVNFSEWAGYSREQQGDLMLASCEDARDGSMPGVYTSVRPATRLSARDIDTICAAARQTEAKR